MDAPCHGRDARHARQTHRTHLLIGRVRFVGQFDLGERDALRLHPERAEIRRVRMHVDALTGRALRLAAGLPAAAHVLPSTGADLHELQLHLVEAGRIEAGDADLHHRKHAPAGLGDDHFVGDTRELLPELLLEQLNVHGVHFGIARSSVRIVRWFEVARSKFAKLELVDVHR